ncbi:thioredoxin family protein [Ekhidna sp.]|uniref:thioredoxin family protein n=1 Tax=Ekhidna sp. TaxID=2608089 RepID=UPI00351132A6
MKVLRILFSTVLILSLGSWKQPEVAEVNWLNFEEAIALHEKQPKKLLIDLYTDWCGWCKVMDRNTYSKAEIANYINENFYPVKFNAEQKEPVEFRGHTFNFVAQGRRGVHELAAALTRNKLSYPTTVFMDEELRIIQPVAGYLKPEQMEPILLFIGEDHFKTTPFEDFKKNHKSSL